MYQILSSLGSMKWVRRAVLFPFYPESFWQFDVSSAVCKWRMAQISHSALVKLLEHKQMCNLITWNSIFHKIWDQSDGAGASFFLFCTKFRIFNVLMDVQCMTLSRGHVRKWRHKGCDWLVGARMGVKDGWCTDVDLLDESFVMFDLSGKSSNRCWYNIIWTNQSDVESVESVDNRKRNPNRMSKCSS